MSEFIINNDILTTFVYLQSTSGKFKYFMGAVKFDPKRDDVTGE
jgi:hypothetical protein